MLTISSKSKLILSLLPISYLLFLLLIVLNPFKQTSTTSHKRSPHLHNHLQVPNSPCEGTPHPELCLSTLSSTPNLCSDSIQHVISATISLTVETVCSSASLCIDLRERLDTPNTLQKRALDDCVELMDYTLIELHRALANLRNRPSNPLSLEEFHDLHTFFSAAMTNQYTCIDGLPRSNRIIRNLVEEISCKTSYLLSNSLAMLNKVPRSDNRGEELRGEKEVGFPRWVSHKDRQRLMTDSVGGLGFDLVVAKDGSGNFTRISEAVDTAPNSSTTRFVIYIKAGAYFENVEVGKKKTMLMFIGDGIEKTVVKARRNFADGWTTFQSATLAVAGDGFIARDLTIENSAGPSKHQAVALRVSADRTAFYRCSFVGYQDTLYVHSFRQFYRDCDVYGTIDFIFGNAAVVLQNCNLYARRPNPEQKNVFTAQGREDPNEQTGISIIASKVAAAADLIPVQSSFKTYLGRPWKHCSRTVFINSHLDDLIDPAGWLGWNDDDDALGNVYYGEYMNNGTGSNTTSRVTWPGYRVINNSIEASQFTVAKLILGDDWLPSYNISYFPGLS